MKLKDFFAKLKKDGKINNAKFDAAIEAMDDRDLDDEAVQAFESVFMTLERAATNKEIHSEIKFKTLNPIDRDLTKIIGVIDTVDKFKSSEIDKMNSTYDKIAAITEYLPKMLDKVKATPATDQETKDKLTKAEETVQTLMKKIEGINSDYDKKVKDIEKQGEEKINNYKLRSYLEKKANSFKFGKAYAEESIRNELTKVKLDALQASNRLAYVTKDGQESVTVLDENGQPRFLNNGNTAVTIESLLEEAFKPLIKASNTEGDDDDEGQQAGRQSTNQKFKVSDEKTKTRQGARTTVQ